MPPEFASLWSLSEFRTIEPKIKMCAQICDSSYLAGSLLVRRGRGSMNNSLQEPPSGFSTFRSDLNCRFKSLRTVFCGSAAECDVRHITSALRSPRKLYIKPDGISHGA